MTRVVCCPNCGFGLQLPGKADDARLAKFTVRMRVYDLEGPSRDSDPICDSADGYPPEHDGIDVIAGLRNVLTECVNQLANFHGEAMHGLTGEYLDMKERGIRPTLSRTGGRGRFTLDYNTIESFSDGRRRPRYRARIDVLRIAGPQESDNEQAL